jgi:hypothetical protein
MKTKKSSGQEKKMETATRAKDSTQANPDLASMTDAERCLKVCGVKPSNNKVGKAFMTSYHKPEEGTHDS